MLDRRAEAEAPRQGDSSADAQAAAAFQEALHRYFTETPEGRASLAQYFRETPEGRAHLREYFRRAPAAPAALTMRELIVAEIRLQQPGFLEAVRLDAALYASAMLVPLQPKSGLALLWEVVRLGWQNYAFLCQVLYRFRVRLSIRRVPILPTLLQWFCSIFGQVEFGNDVLLEPGVYIPHGKVVADGVVRIGRGTMIMPWVTLGLTTDISGPSIGRDVLIGTGAKILGRVTVGDRARVGANAVVLCDVPSDTTVAGAPATVVRDRRAAPDVADPALFDL
jgi:serine O-acetyltransferase